MVSTLAKVTQGREGYYTKLSREDYYTSGGEPEGVFLGEGAEKLGLTSTPIRYQDVRLRLLFQGINPNDGLELRRGSATERTYRTRNGEEKAFKPVLAHDITLSPDKSVSVLWAVSGYKERHQIETAHASAVHSVVHYVSDRCYTRCGAGGISREKVAPIFAAFQHSVSREVDPGRYPDPQLHTHLLLLNVGIRTNGKGGAVDARELFSLQKSIGQVYRDSLQVELSKLGLTLEHQRLKGGFGFRIQGVPEALCHEFSQRHAQISPHIQPGDSAKQIHAKVLATRKPKQLEGIGRNELFEYWRSVARELTFEPKALWEKARAEKQHSRWSNLSPSLEKYMVTQQLAQERHTLSTPTASASHQQLDRKSTQIGDLLRRALADARAYAPAVLPHRINEVEYHNVKNTLAKERQRRERKLLFLRAVGKLSYLQYKQLTDDRWLPTSKLGINFAYATHQISRKQQRYLLTKHDHVDRDRKQPDTKLGINLAYATGQLTKGQQLYLLYKNGHTQYRLRFRSLGSIVNDAREIRYERRLRAEAQRNHISRQRQNLERER